MHTHKDLAPIPLTKGGHGVVLWVIIAAVLIGGGYAAYRNYQQPTTDNQQQGTQANINTKNWKTYRNEEYGFEFKYPDMWKLEECATPCVSAVNIPDRIAIYPETPFKIDVNVRGSNAEEEISRVQKIIDADYSPDYSDPNVGGANVYTAEEGWRLEIQNFINPNGLKIFHTNFTGKYSIVERNFSFNIGQGSINIHTSSDVACAKACEGDEDEAFFSSFPEFEAFIDSIRVIPR